MSAKMNANETALLLIEFQNEFCAPYGKNYGYVKKVLDKTILFPTP